MKNFQQIANNIDPVPLLVALQRHHTLWQEDTYLRDYPQGPFGDTESIMLRFPVKGVYDTEAALQDHLSAYDQHECIWYPAFDKLPQARQLIFNLMGYLQGERLGRVMINKIRPGGRIAKHADTPAHAAYYSRYHIVLQSSPGFVFTCGGEQVFMPAGSVFWFRNALDHEVINGGRDDRISMVIDIRGNQ